MQDRLIGALLALVVSSAAVIALPFAVVVALRGHPWKLMYLYDSIRYWGGAIVFLAVGVGFVAGPRDVGDLLSQMFFYAEDAHPALTLTAWIVTIGIGAPGYWLARIAAATSMH